MDMIYYQEVKLKQYGDGQVFIVMTDGNFLCKQGFDSMRSAENWMRKQYPLTAFAITYEDTFKR